MKAGLRNRLAGRGRIECAAFLLFSAAAGSLVAQGYLGVDPASGQSALVSGNGGLTLGWEFEVTAPQGIYVNGLAFWDDLSNGFFLNQTFPVGLWNPTTGALLQSTVVSSTSSLEPSMDPTGGWRVNAVLSVFLAPGLYRIGALMPTNAANQIVDSGSTFQAGPGVELTQFLRQLGSPTLAMPDDPLAEPGDTAFGPTFTFTPAVPEPGSAWLLVTALVLLRVFVTFNDMGGNRARS